MFRLSRFKQILNNLRTGRTPILSNERGLSLAEMLIVIALIAVVSTILFRNFGSKFQRAKIDSAKIQMRTVMQSLEEFRRDCGRYPTGEQGLDALLAKPTTGVECTNYSPDGYFSGGKNRPKDPFGRDYVYESDGSKYTLTFLGNDGAVGGEDLDKDITSEDLL